MELHAPDPDPVNQSWFVLLLTNHTLPLLYSMQREKNSSTALPTVIMVVRTQEETPPTVSLPVLFLCFRSYRICTNRTP